MSKTSLNVAHKRIDEVSRRDFLKFCSVLAVSIGIPGMGARVAEAITSPKRPSVIWLSGQCCSGCIESLLRPSHPTLEHLILDLISLDYNETLNTGAGYQAEEALHKSIQENDGKFILVVEGAVPVKDNGIYCKVAGRPFVNIVKETAEKAAAIIAIGSCSSWGGIAASYPNPTGATSVSKVLPGMTVVAVPGCPPNAYNFLSTVTYFLTFKRLPELDKLGRPKFAYGQLIHDYCERRTHFNAGRFAEKFGDDEHKNGYCLYKLGCKGPVTYANCPTVLFNDIGSGGWPVGTGHPCFGCTEHDVGFNIPMHAQADIADILPSNVHAPIVPDKKDQISAGAAALLAGVAGTVVGGGVVLASRIGKKEDHEDDQS